MGFSFIDSASSYGIADASNVWTVSSNFNHQTGGRYAGSAIGWTNGGGTSVRPLRNQTTSFCWQLNVYFTGFAGVDLIGVLENGTKQLCVTISSGGAITVTRNGSTLATASMSFVTGTWYHVEFKGTIDNTSGSFELKINGTSVATGSSVDTQASSNNYADQFMLSSLGFGPAVYYCDMVFQDDQGGAPDFIGELRVARLTPNADGAHTDFIPSAGTNYQNVDDAASDGDSTYNTAVAVGDRDTVTFSGVSGSFIPFAVQLSAVARRTDTGSAKISLSYRQGSTDYDDAAELTLSTSYQRQIQMLEQNPATSANWTSSEINAIEAGVLVTELNP